jgi:hypothetical protein
MPVATVLETALTLYPLAVVFFGLGWALGMVWGKQSGRSELERELEAILWDLDIPPEEGR